MKGYDDKISTNKTGRASKFKIDWEKVKKLSLEQQRKYFKDLCLVIIREPVTKPASVYLDNKYYTINIEHKDVLNEAYGEYRRLCKVLDEKNEKATAHKIDWNVVEKLDLKRRAQYFETLIKTIERDPIKNPVSFKSPRGYCVIDKKNYEVYYECVLQYENALKGISELPKKASKKKNKKAHKDKDKKTKKKLEFKMPVLFKRKKQKIYSPLVNNRPPYLASSIIAGALCVSYAINSVASLLPGFLHKEEEEPTGISYEDLKHDIENAAAKTFNTYFSVVNLTAKNIGVATKLIATPFSDAVKEGFEEAKIQIEKERRAALIDEYFEEYCLYFNLDSSKVIEIIRDKTDNYELSFDEIVGDKIYYGLDDEAACMVIVRQIYRDRLSFTLKSIGLKTSDLKTSNKILRPTKNEDGVWVERNGETYTVFMSRVCDMLGTDKYYNLAISFHETGRATSPLCVNSNNMGGMKNLDGSWASFPSQEAGIITFCMNLKAYEKYNIKSWQRMANIYAEGSESWIKNVKSMYREVTRDSEKHFGVPFEGKKVSDQNNQDKVLTLEETD